MKRSILKTFFFKHNRNTTPSLVSGFTLIELMVATTIFVVVVVASMGSLFTLLDASKGSKALRSAMDNVNFAMDSMTRSIRMGTNYYCISDGSPMSPSTSENLNCSDGGQGFSFVPQKEDGASPSRVGYMAETITDANGESHRTLKRCDSPTHCVSIVSSDVNIEKLKFFTSGSGVDDTAQAKVYIIMKGTVMVKGVPTSFAIQTLASQRNF